MSDLKFEIVRALYKQGVFKRVSDALTAADEVIKAIGLREDDRSYG